RELPAPAARLAGPIRVEVAAATSEVAPPGRRADLGGRQSGDSTMEFRFEWVLPIAIAAGIALEKLAERRVRARAERRFGPAAGSEESGSPLLPRCPVGAGVVLLRGRPDSSPAP